MSCFTFNLPYFAQFSVQWGNIEMLIVLQPTFQGCSFGLFSDMNSRVFLLHMNNADYPLRRIHNNTLQSLSVFVYSTSTPESALITKSSLDIFVGVFYVYGTTFWPWDICILCFFFNFASVVCLTHHQHIHLLGEKPVQDLLLFSHMSSFPTKCEGSNSYICILTYSPSEYCQEIIRRSVHLKAAFQFDL